MATAKISIEADVQQAQAALRGLVTSLQNVQTATSGLEKSIGTSLGNSLTNSANKTKQFSSSLDDARVSSLNLTNVMAGLLTTLSVATVIKSADSYTTLSNQIRSTSKDTTEFNKAMDAVGKIALETGTPLAQVGTLYTKLSISGQQLGVSQDRILQSTRGISQQLKLLGLDTANATSVMYQFGQAVGLGYARTEEFKQIMEASPKFVQELAKQFGKTTAQFMADVAAFKVGSEDLLDATARMTGNPMWKEYKATVGDALTNISTQFQILLGRLESGTGVFSGIANVLNFVGENLDLVTAAGAAFFTMFAIKKIVDVSTALATLNGVMKANPWVLLASVLASAGVALYSYMKTTDDATKVIEKETQAQKDMNDAALKYKGPKIDVGALTTAAEDLGKQQQFLTSIAGLNKQRQEQEKAIADFAKAQKVPLELIPDVVKNILRQDVARRQNAEIQHSISQDMVRIEKEIEIASAGNLLTQEKLKAVEKVRSQYGQEVADRYKQQLETAVQTSLVEIKRAQAQNQYNDAFNEEQNYRNNINKLSATALDRITEIAKIQSQYNGLLSNETATQIYNTEQRRKQLEYLKQMKTATEAVNTPLSGGAAGAQAAGQLGQLDPVTAQTNSAITLFNGLDELRKLDLISEQQYQTAKINAAVQAQTQIYEASKKTFENQELLRIQQQTGTQFGFETQKQMAAEAAKFDMKSTTEKTQFAIEQGATIFSALGAQNKKAFEAAKAFNIANAIMNTYMGATKALATYPFPFGLIAATAAVAAGMAQVAQIRSQQYSGRQLGGPVMSGQSYIVGENGPEMFTPNNNGSITRNGDLSSGGPVNVNFTIIANDTTGFDELLTSRQGVIKQIISDAMLERGQRSML